MQELHKKSPYISPLNRWEGVNCTVDPYDIILDDFGWRN